MLMVDYQLKAKIEKNKMKYLKNEINKLVELLAKIRMVN
jgi:hypothetical protein